MEEQQTLKERIRAMQAANKGTCFLFGSYIQGNMHTAPKEPIEWIVLERSGDKLLCISKYLLECRPYHETLEAVEWATCDLRKWLNGTFYNAAFTAQEQACFLRTDVQNPSQNTQDCLFLLSMDEAETIALEERGAKATAYAKEQGAWVNTEEGDNFENGCWWLRYYGDCEEEEKEYDTLSCVNYDGNIEYLAEEVNSEECCVRPAFWLNINEKQ